MASILTAAGFENLESMQEFLNRFPAISGFLDDDLEKIWICHKNADDMPKNGEIIILPCEDYRSLSKRILKKIVAAKRFYSLLTEFSALGIFKKIYSLFNVKLTSYLFTKCYLFYNWGISALEPIIDHFEIHSKIQAREQRVFRRIQRKVSCNFSWPQSLKNVNPTAEMTRKKRTNLASEPTRSLKLGKSKQVSFKSVLKAVKGQDKFYNYLKNDENPYYESFNLKQILYDMKQRPWPRHHVLNRTIDDLIKFVIKVPIGTDFNIENELLNKSGKWVLLRELLEKFIKNHERLRRNDGYGRVLKKHLKSVKTPPERRLHPVPKSVVCSYVLDILRRTLPPNLFGKNRVRKSFFSELVKVIKGNKDEHFMWYTVLRRLLANKFTLLWCLQLGTDLVQSQIILKLFKFLIIHYVFVILRNHFYVTETGSSGFSLSFYRKSDMESASSACVKKLLQRGQIRLLNQAACDGQYTIEGNWLETGKIFKKDLRNKLKVTMIPGTEYRQPTAHVRFLPKSDCGDDLRIITKIAARRKCPEAKSGNEKLEKYFSSRLAMRKKNLFFVKLFLQYLVDRKGFGIKPLPCNRKLEAAWSRAVYLKEKYGKLFFVKADISDAFGSVNHDVLAEVLRTSFEEEVKQGKVELKKIIEWKSINRRIQKVARFSFSNRAAENSILINRSVFLYRDKKINHCLNAKFLEIINQVVLQQNIEIKGKVFRVTKGLAQGSAGRFSTQLCEIYCSSMDCAHISPFVDSTDSVLVRGVDDYLFITSDLEKARGFLNLVENGIPGYDIRFNGHKLKSNLIDDINEVQYLGLVFNFENMRVKPSYSKYRQKDLLSTMNLFDKWGNNHFNKELFLKRRSLRLKCLKLHPIVISRNYNSLKMMRRTVFEACVMQSLRVITLADYLFPDKVKNDAAIYQILSTSCSRIKRTLASCEISPDEVNWLFFFSALNISQKYSGQFKVLLLVIRFRLQKCEKAFAKNGTELLLDLLKSDILDERYWKEVSGEFRELSRRPLKVA